jgi:transcription-repair coupling factor (superfamily II helicase)
LLENLVKNIKSSNIFRNILDSAGESIFFTGLRGSFISFVVASLFEKNTKIIYCSNDPSKLFRLKDDINLILGNELASIYLGEYDEEFESEVSPLSLTLKKLSLESSYIILTSPKSLDKRILSEDSFKSNIISLKKNDEYTFEDLVHKLNEFGFTRKKMVEEENDYALRGGIVDIFPENLDQPVRLEFFGNTIESIREFDIATQRSISQIEQVQIFPSADKMSGISGPSIRLLDYAGEQTLLLIDEPDLISHEYKDLFTAASKFRRSYFSGFPLLKSDSLGEDEKSGIKEIVFEAKSQPAFNSNMKNFAEHLKELSASGFVIYIACTDDHQVSRINDLLEEHLEDNTLASLKFLNRSFHEGFTLPEGKISLYTEHEVFGRYFRSAKRKRKFGGITFKELSAVNYGDFMVHQNYGIGKYAGLKKIVTGGVEQEAVKLLYKDNDMVFVNLNSLSLIKKYSAQEGVSPKLNKLGGNEWDRIKQRTKKKIQEIAKDLILLYSKRKSQKGFRFSADSVWQKELEASFMYEDTPDQVSATEALKNDMESETPMDRLVCGDVGFGKTEVAVRAAFKAVMDNKQAAILVPTTILAEQHYNTFKDRLSNWAVEVEHLSRFKTKKEQKEILGKLEDGKINIIIGTHRLLSKDVMFRDLGLLIIDEEQRFGVKAKEKLKFMRENVDALTLTATPIPRTLNFSLMGARDLSIINTPPKNRQPIHTEIINFDKKQIADAITRELHRGGQVYFVNDRIAKLEELAEMIEEIVPYAKVAIAHGQMSPAELENVMMRFLEKKTSVLLCTKIIESGLDIPSVNTIIINRADNFGLAELYQLRGRVGRSNLKSFAYLITPPQSILTRQAVRRLHALEEFTELGSGMNLALKDLEIRGAGNLLGKEQSGFISEIGFDMYLQILDEAVAELKEALPADSLPAETMQKLSAQKKPAGKDVAIESDISMFIPESYIDDENTRLELYQRLSNLKSNSELQAIHEEFVDRFGKLPEEVTSLLNHIEIKLILSSLGFEKISISGDQLEIFFDINNNEIYISGYFEKVLGFINEHFKNTSRVKQSKNSLSVLVRIPQQQTPAEKLAKIYGFVEKLADL